MADEFTVPARSTTYPATPAGEDRFEPEYPVYDSVPGSFPEGGSGSSDSTTDTAKNEAAQVGQSAADAGKHVAGVTREQAAGVAGEAADQAKNLYHQTREELRGQASTQQERVASGIRSLSGELAGMADRSNAGPASDLVREVSDRAGELAGWLEQRDPAALLQEVTGFARRRPGTFLAIAAGAGLIAGRLTRGAVSAARDNADSTGTASSTTPAAAPAAYVAPVEPAPYEPVVGYEQPTYETTPYEETARPGFPVRPDDRSGL